MTIRPLTIPVPKAIAVTKTRTLRTGPPSNPPIDAAEFERRLDQMDRLLGR
jgi:hypothetical protein